MKYYYQKANKRWLEHFMIVNDKNTPIELWALYTSGWIHFIYSEKDDKPLIPETANELNEKQFKIKQLERML